MVVLLRLMLKVFIAWVPLLGLLQGRDSYLQMHRVDLWQIEIVVPL